MADQEQVQVLLRDLGKLVGLGELRLDDEGHCSLVFDRTVEVDLAHAEGEDRLTLAALLGTLPGDAAQGRYAELLDANFFWRGTQGATIGVERESGTAVLIEALPLDGLDIGRLERHLDAFVTTAQNWMERLGQAPEEARATPSASPGTEFILRA